MTLIPDFKVYSETVPKKFTTPTCPAGITVKICETEIRAKTPANVPVANAVTREPGVRSLILLRADDHARNRMTVMSKLIMNNSQSS